MARSTPSSGIAADLATATRGAGRRPLVLNLLISLRPGQWTKNLLVFAGLLFGQRLFDTRAVEAAAAAFAVFCALSGVVYLIHDIADRESDRQHPLKSRRPIASGAVPVSWAWTFAAIIGVTAIGAAFAISPQFAAVALGYVTLLVLYSAFLKHVVIIDVLTIAIGFVLRAVAGAVAVD